MWAKSFLFLFFVVNVMVVFSQKTVKIYGVVSDAKTDERLQAATIKNNTDLSNSTTSNFYGYYLLIVPSSTNVNIEVSFVGYQTQFFYLNLKKDTLLDINLSPGVKLKEFTVSAPKTRNTRRQIGQLELSEDAIRWAPAFAGENNIMLALKAMPGVSAGKEGSSELFVRGGSHDQNLILLDKIPVYNLNHAFGLMSVFNSSALKNVSLFKGAIPAVYGGRLSSVLDISVKEGNRKKYDGDVSISTIASTFTVEGPVIKDKASFLVSARRSWPDILIRGMSNNNNGGLVLGYYFMDINAKTNFSINKKHHFYFSGYLGKDMFFADNKEEDQESSMNQGWGNKMISMRYQSISENSSFNDVLLYFSSYNEFDENWINASDINMSNKNGSNLGEFGFKLSKEFSGGSYVKYKFGLNGLHRIIQQPEKEIEDDNVNNQTVKKPEVIQKEISGYASAHFLSGNFGLQIGLRSNFYNSGISEMPLFEPRLSFLYKINKSFSIKAGAMRNSQSVFAMPKSTLGMPGYTWLPTSGKVKTQTSWQISHGISFNRKKFGLDVEAYYKKLENIIGNYMYPSSLYQSTQWFDIIDQGRGKAVGIDFLSTYNSDEFSVNLKYSLSKTLHSFPTVLNGKWIPADYDIRNDLVVMCNWILQEKNDKKKWITGKFSAHSGRPISMPVQSIKSFFPVLSNEHYSFDFTFLDYYRKPNNIRLNTFHRLDLGIHFQKKQIKGERTWSVGILNVYNRKNPYSIYKNQSGEFKQVVLFPIMPFVAFNKSF